MIKKFLLLLMLSLILLPSTSVLAGDPPGIFKQATGKLQTTAKSAELGDVTQSPTNLISNAINSALGFLGIIAVILFIYAGGLWLTAAGSEDKVTKAKKIMKNAVIGIVIVALAYGITAAVFNLVIPASAPAPAPAAGTPPK